MTSNVQKRVDGSSLSCGSDRGPQWRRDASSIHIRQQVRSVWCAFMFSGSDRGPYPRHDPSRCQSVIGRPTRLAVAIPCHSQASGLPPRQQGQGRRQDGCSMSALSPYLVLYSRCISVQSVLYNASYISVSYCHTAATPYRVIV